MISSVLGGLLSVKNCRSEKAKTGPEASIECLPNRGRFKVGLTEQGAKELRGRNCSQDLFAHT